MARQRVATSRTKDAYDRIRADLVKGVFAPGAKLMISELQKFYDIGAMPIREALNRLSAELLVQKTEQRGFFVPPLDAETFLEIQSARIVIETEALRQSIADFSPEWEERMVIAMHRLRKSGNAEEDADFAITDAWAEAHQTFHRDLISGCHNSWLLNFADKLYEQSARYRQRLRQISSLNPPVRANLVDEHAEILDAALACETERAVGLLIEHYRRSVEIVLGEPVRLSAASTCFERSVSRAAE